jgi:hypothetical protein
MPPHQPVPMMPTLICFMSLVSKMRRLSPGGAGPAAVSRGEAG